MSFGDFYKNIGFEEYPFGEFTSESERARRKELFVDTSLYSPIVKRFATGNTLILSGDRGTGKTAVLYDFIRRLDTKTTLLVEVSDFSDLKTDYDLKQLYIFLTQQLSDALFKEIASRKLTAGKLRKQDRVLLSYYLYRYTKQVTKNLLSEALDRLQAGFWRKAGVWVYSATRHTLNIGANGAVHFIGDLVARGMGVPPTDSKWNEYFPELKISVDADFADAEGSLVAFRRLVRLSKELGFQKVVLILDKLDEDPRFENAAEEIASFASPMLTDNKLLLDNEFQLVVSIWLIPLNMLKDAVRTQKLNWSNIHWSSLDMKLALERRLCVFSKNKIQHISDLFDENVSEAEINSIIELSNKNPRDLWHVMDSIMRVQYKMDPSKEKIESQAISAGLNDFVVGFNFYEYYPKKSNARKNSMDVYAYIKHLLRLDGAEFTRNRLNEKAGTGSSTPNYLVGMESMGLIETTGSEAGSTTYRIRDPKVRYAIEHGIDISRGE